jgi:predicted nucleic acid-binding protein
LIFLVDTNVLSEISGREYADKRVLAWFDSVPESDLYVSVIAVGEIEQGVERLRRRDPEQARVYEEWLDKLQKRFSDRIMPVTLEVAYEWGRLNVPDPIGTEDGLIAATAKVNGLTVATRNVSDFVRTGVNILNPWEHAADN